MTEQYLRNSLRREIRDRHLADMTAKRSAKIARVLITASVAVGVLIWLTSLTGGKIWLFLGILLFVGGIGYAIFIPLFAAFYGATDWLMPPTWRQAYLDQRDELMKDSLRDSLGLWLLNNPRIELDADDFTFHVEALQATIKTPKGLVTYEFNRDTLHIPARFAD